MSKSFKKIHGEREGEIPFVYFIGNLHHWCVLHMPSSTGFFSDFITVMTTDSMTSNPPTTNAATMGAVGITTQAPPTCEALAAVANQVISYTGGCSVEINCQALYSCSDNYELMGGASLRTCSLPSDMIPVWSGVAPTCQLRSKLMCVCMAVCVCVCVCVYGCVCMSVCECVDVCCRGN